MVVGVNGNFYDGGLFVDFDDCGCVFEVFDECGY